MFPRFSKWLTGLKAQRDEARSVLSQAADVGDAHGHAHEHVDGTVHEHGHGHEDHDHQHEGSDRRPGADA